MRRPDWETDLADYLISVRDKPHVYGKHDCMLFVAGAVQALTGNDFAKGHRGKYATADEAKEYLRSIGFASVTAMLNKHLKKKPVSFAQRGDVVMGKDGVPGVAMGDYAFFVGQEGEQEGLVRKPQSEWLKAWAVE